MTQNSVIKTMFSPEKKRILKVYSQTNIHNVLTTEPKLSNVFSLGLNDVKVGAHIMQSGFSF